MLGLGTVLACLTIVFGAAPMRVCRRVYGRAAYWVGHLAIAAALAAAGFGSYALIVLGLAVMVGAYAEVEEHGGSLFSSGAIAILAMAGALTSALGIGLRLTKGNLLQVIRAEIVPVVEQLTRMNPQVQINVDSILQQLPSGVLIVAMVSMLIALIWERRIFAGFRITRLAPYNELRSFRVPDFVVWIVAATILGAFFRHGIGWLEIGSMNILNVVVVVYFFQGLAVVAHAFRTYKVNPFWQWFWYLMIVLQLAVVVSFIGFVDYWLEFRERLSRKPAEPTKEF
jgi:hypothetical protein